ncbi:MAG: hypothetical protein HY078_02700 [Elusimicrobia bacterium]|nr:hypothetical protein [Elusimicrobiota bacterium]
MTREPRPAHPAEGPSPGAVGPAGAASALLLAANAQAITEDEFRVELKRPFDGIVSAFRQTAEVRADLIKMNSAARR